MIEYKFEYEKTWNCPHELMTLQDLIAEQYPEYIFPGMSVTILDNKIVVALLSENGVTDDDLKSISNLIYAFDDSLVESESLVVSENIITPIDGKTIKFELNKE